MLWQRHNAMVWEDGLAYLDVSHTHGNVDVVWHFQLKASKHIASQPWLLFNHHMPLNCADHPRH